MPRFSLSAVGVDRPGIVAAVSGALAGLGGNLEDSTMTFLQGQFAILLVVETAPHVTTSMLEGALVPAADRFDLVVTVRALDDQNVSSAASVEGDGGTPWTIAVHGADRTGIVHGVTSALADAGGNVVDLSTHLVGAPEAPMYVMTLRVTLPGHPDPEAAAERVRASAEALGVHCSVRPDDADTL